MIKFVRLLWILNLAILGTFGLLGCSGSQFQGSKPQGASAPSADAPAAGSSPSAEGESPSNPTPGILAETLGADDSAALEGCRAQWKEARHPFSDEAWRRPLIVNVDRDVQNNSLAYADSQQTAEPTLILIRFGISVGNQATLDLKNSKGWYCLSVRAKVINNFRVNAACRDQVAIEAKYAQNDHNFLIDGKACQLPE